MKNNTSKSIGCALLAIAAAVNAQPVFADDGPGLKLQAGGFVGIAPEYEGSKSYQVIGAPFIAPSGVGAMEDGVVQVRGIDDIRLRLFNYNGFQAGVLGGWRFDRDQDDGDGRLLGLGDVDGGLVVGGYAAYTIGAFMPFISYHREVTSDNDTGGVLKFGTEAKTEFAPGYGVRARIGASYADDDYMDAYFSITPGQALTSVAGLPVYDAESGIKDVFFGLSGEVPITPDWKFIWTGTYSRLVGDAADSPIVETEDQFSGGIGLTYTFNSGF